MASNFMLQQFTSEDLLFSARVHVTTGCCVLSDYSPVRYWYTYMPDTYDLYWTLYARLFELTNAGATFLE